MTDDDVKFQTKPEDQDKRISFEIGYIVPFWSSKPNHKYSLDIWREGVIVDNIDISKKEYYLIGRNKNLCDVYLNNMTVSRIHCVIQHKDDGGVYLYDLDSVYGTFINKRPIAKKSYVKLNVGDTFKLGQSNRMFILNGPEELQSQEEVNEISHTENNPMKYVDRKELMEKRVNMIRELYNQEQEYKKSLMSNYTDVNWGQRDYDNDILQHQREEDEVFNSNKEKISQDLEGSLNLIELKERKDLSERQRSTLTKLENTMTGIKKLKEEILKLKKKEMDQGELTEGQLKRVQMDEKKLNDLVEKYEQMENNLKISLSSKDVDEAYVEQKFDRKLAKELDSDDEFFDRTSKVTNQRNINNLTKSDNANVPVITENYESLKQKLENTIRNRQKLIDKLQKSDQDKNSSTKEEIDSLDAYFLETQNQLKSDQKVSLTNQINDMTKEIAKTQKLLSLVTPSHIKIKYKGDEEIEKNITKPQVVTSESKLPQDQNKKKKSESIAETVNRLNKMSKKLSQENGRKVTDSDEELMGVVENYKDMIGKEVEMDENFQRKIEEFKRSINHGSKKESKEEDKAGLIVNMSNNSQHDKKDNSAFRENLFEEIVNNLSNPNFDIGNYNLINKFFNTKDKNKQSSIEIDFSSGGLQTFKSDSDFTQRKRDREDKKYGVTPRPQERNVQEQAEENDENDYDVIYTVGENMGKEHDLNVNRYENKFTDINEDF
jgi:hypothetical protein